MTVQTTPNVASTLALPGYELSRHAPMLESCHQVQSLRVRDAREPSLERAALACRAEASGRAAVP
jgi:hypothetical protein